MLSQMEFGFNLWTTLTVFGGGTVLRRTRTGEFGIGSVLDSLKEVKNEMVGSRTRTSRKWLEDCIDKRLSMTEEIRGKQVQRALLHSGRRCRPGHTPVIFCFAFNIE